MSVIGELLVEINGDNSGLKKSLSESGTVAKTGIDKLVGTIGLATLAWKGVELAMKGIDYNKAAEQAEIAFGVFLGSSSAAVDMIEKMRDLAKETPLEFADVRDAGLKLQAFGVATEKIIPSMRMLSDVSAGLQIPVKDLAYLFGSVQAQGKALTVDLMQFANRGIPIWTELAKVTGVQGAALKKMVEEGKIGFPQVEQAFKNMTSEGGKFHEMAVKQMDSLAGAQSNLNDSFNVWLGAQTKALTGPMKDMSKWLADFFAGWLALDNAWIKFQNDAQKMVNTLYGVSPSSKQVMDYWQQIADKVYVGYEDQLKFAQIAHRLATEWGPAYLKNNKDVNKTIDEMVSKYGLTREQVDLILTKTRSTDDVTKKIVESELARGVFVKQNLATATDYASLEKASATEAAKFAADRKAQQDAFNAAFKSYSDSFDSYTQKAARDNIDEEARLKAQIDLRNKYKDTLYEMAKNGTISNETATKEIERINGLNKKNLGQIVQIKDMEEAIKIGKKAMADAQDVVSEKTLDTLNANMDWEDSSEGVTTFMDLQKKLAFGTFLELSKNVDATAEIQENVEKTTSDANTLLLAIQKIAYNIAEFSKASDFASQQFASLANSAKMLGDDYLSSILSKMSQFAKEIGDVSGNLAKVVASGGSDIGADIALVVDGIALISDAWSSFFGGKTEAEKKAAEESARLEAKRIEAVKKLDEEYQAKFDSDLVRLEKERDERVAYARKIGADVLQIESYYAGEIEKVRRTTADISVESGRVEAEKKAIVDRFYELKKQYVLQTKEMRDLEKTYPDFSKEFIERTRKLNSEYYASADSATVKKWTETATGFALELSKVFVDLNEKMQNELGQVVYNLQLFEERAQGATQGIGQSLVEGLKSGATLGDFRKTIMDMLRNMAIEAAIIAGGFQEKFKEIGVMIAEALKDGILSESELTRVDLSVNALYSSAIGPDSAISKLNTLFDRAAGAQSITNGGGTTINIQTTNDPLTIANAVSNVQESLAYQGVI